MPNKATAIPLPCQVTCPQPGGLLWHCASSSGSVDQTGFCQIKVQPAVCVVVLTVLPPYEALLSTRCLDGAGSATADARYLASSQEPDEELQSLLSYEQVCQNAVPDLKVTPYPLHTPALPPPHALPFPHSPLPPLFRIMHG